MTEAQEQKAEDGVHRTVTSLREFADEVSILAAEGRTIWFRGARDVRHDLRPGLFRHPTLTQATDLIDLEWQLLNDYRHQAPPFKPSIPASDLELLFVMQHYRVPTRLLDWTENPFTALFFATENARDEDPGSELDAAVWVINPIELNRKTFPNRVNAARVLGAYAKDIQGLLPAPTVEGIEITTPCAIYGVHNTPRIVAQRGSFILYGRDTSSMEDQVSLNLMNDNVLRKIVVTGPSKREIFSHLFNMGISDSVVYPDLDGLSREIRNRRGFLK
ncbi:FRG domain-containing protein [Croceibacterium mercuriale]|uniref:FRG domain-containing protein n=1 Tax=Croceibacterium mercuriale TaxID=1572751 RepID=UPI0013792DD5|nr:FRG domain-containing protein [Croceibacterium mercuriale]